MNRQDAKDAKLRREEPGVELDRLAHDVIGAAIEVHRVMGPGFLEVVYEDALAMELEDRGIAFARQLELPLQYKGRPLNRSHRLDLLVDRQLIVELKATVDHHPIYEATVLSYLRAFDLPLGLLINFNVPLLKNGIRRIVCT